MYFINSRVINLISALGLLVFPFNALPSIALPSQSIRPVVQKTATSEVVQFVGTGEPQIQVLQGVPRSELLVQMFRGGRWLFYPNSKFMFVPSENANVRSDLYPITGTYRKSGNNLEFQAERKSDSGASASVDGVIRVEGDKVLLEVTQITDAKISRRIARISQTLSLASQVTVQPPRKIQNIQVPSFFRVSLRGKTEAQPFGPIPATLKILPSPSGDSNPFFVILKTEDDTTNGSLLWSSFAPIQAGQREFYSKITVKNNQVRLDVNPSQEKSRLDVSWTTLSSGKIGELLDRSSIGVTVSQGTMTFSMQGNSISGRVQAEGVSWFNNPSRYEAEFTGQLTTDNVTFPIQNQFQTKQLLNTTKQASEQTIPFTGTWDVQPFGSLSLYQKGQEVSGEYTGRGRGKIQGRIEGNRLDFTWKDSTGQGWGFFRAIADGTTLVGMWGSRTDKADGQNLVAIQTSSPSSSSPMSVNSNDMRELRDRGYDLVLQGKCPQAIKPLSTALDLFKQEGRSRTVSQLMKVSALIDVVNIQTRLSHCYFQLQDYDKLLVNLNDVIETRRQLNQKEYIAIINREQANIIQSSLSGYSEMWRQRLKSDPDKIAALEKSQPFLHSLMRLFVDSGNVEEALLVAEKSKARAFADLLSTRLSSNQFLSDATAPTIQQIQQIAKLQNATLIEYALVCEASNKPNICNAYEAIKLFIWIVKPTGEIKFREVDFEVLRKQGKSLGTLIDDNYVAIKNELENPASNNSQPSLKQLHQLLIHPIATLLPPPGTNPRVIFSPQRELFLVPFSALLNANGKYLIQEYTSILTPSIQVLDLTRQLRQRNTKFSGDVLIVGNPKLSSKLALDPLTEWEQAAQDIAKLFGTKAIIGEQATRNEVLNLMARSRIIHLAAHATFNDEQGLESWIALAPSAGNDGRLSAEDLLSLYAPPKQTLRAELVVLAACQTGQGRITGDGVYGLSRSFIAAGIPSTIVSLWTVRQEPTISLMKEFYRSLSSGKAEALRRAMLKTMKEYPDQPGAWAGFTLIGEAE